MPRPHPKKGERGLVNLDRFLGLAGSLGARRHGSGQINLRSDWSGGHGRAGRRFKFIQQAMALRLASHMTTLKLQSHWSAQIPFPGPRIVSKFTRPFSLLEGGVWGRDYGGVVQR